MAILRRFTPLVEPISIDEAFLDVTGLAAAVRRRRGDRPADQGRRSATSSELTISVGVATTKLVAKIASDLRKPDGLVVVAPGDGGGVPRAAADLAAVGRRAEVRGGRCSEYGVRDDRRPGGAARRPPRPPVRQARARRSAIARAASTPTRSATGTPAKSVGHEHTFDVDTSDREVIERTLLAMAEGVAGRLRDSGVKAATVTVKIRDTLVPTRSPASGRCPSRPT